MNTKLTLPALALLAVSGSVGSALSMDGAGPDENVAHVVFLPGWQLSDDVHMAGIRIELAEGWHTYWRQPGDAGVPPLLDLSGSHGISNAELHFPSPELIESYGLTSIGYSGVVVLPLELTRTGEIELNGTLTIGVCEEVCVPMDFAFQAKVPAGGSPDRAIQASLDARPRTVAAQATCSASPIDDGMAISVDLPGTRLADARRVVIETSITGMWVSEPQLTESGGALTATAELVPPDAKPFMLDRSDVRVTVFSSGGAKEYLGCKGRS